MNNTAAPLSQALALHQAGNLQQAEELYLQILQDNPAHADAWHLSGVAALNTGRIDVAVDRITKAIELDGKIAVFHRNLGLVHQTAGRLQDALASYEYAMQLDPGYLNAQHDRGLLLYRMGRLAEAEAHYRDVIRRWPDAAAIYLSLGNTLLALQRPAEAAASYRKSLGLRPDSLEGFLNLGAAYRTQGNMLEAQACYKEAIRLKPNDLQCYTSYSGLRQEQGDCTEAIAIMDMALSTGPVPDALKVKAALIQPVLYESLEDVESKRKQFIHKVEQLHRLPLSVKDPAGDINLTSFYLAYQGHNNRDLQSSIAAMYTKAAPVLSYVAPHCAPGVKRSPGPIRIGFLCRYFYNHTIGRLMTGIVRNLDRNDFHVSVFSFAGKADELALAIRHQAEYVELPGRLEAAQLAVARQKLDVLFYPEIGMDAFTYYMAYARLAPVQCLTWGHPDTTGIPALDYFISSELVEIPEADQHYTEKLVRLRNLPTYYQRATVATESPGRAYFGLSDDDHLYGCFQSSFKIHPSMDPLFAGILRKDPRGRILLLEGQYPRWKDILVERFTRFMPDVSDRILFIPRQKHQNFLHLTLACDVSLDPLPFGSGNTAFEGLGLGMPIVTWPATYMRGRVTHGIYRKMGYLECVAENAEQFIEKSVRIANDPDYRAHVRAQILAASAVIYEDLTAVRELESFFKAAVAK